MRIDVATPIEVAALPALHEESAPADRRASRITRAVLLGAGSGTALCPLSALRPRYLWPVANVPLCVPLLNKLHCWGIRSAVLSCSHPASGQYVDLVRPHMARSNLCFSFVAESGLQGTAGIVRSLCDCEDDEPVLVLSANMLTNLHINPAFHLDQLWHQDALATVLVERPTDATAMDRMRLDDDGCVREIRTGNACHEDAHDEWTSAGAWVLSAAAVRQIPTDRYCSLREQLLPEFLERGGTIRAVPIDNGFASGTACRQYLDRHQQAMLGAAYSESPVPGYRRIKDKVWAAPSAAIADATALTGPVVVGEDCRIEHGVTIHGPVAIGDDCHIYHGATIESSVLWNGARIGARAKVRDAIVTDGTEIPTRGNLAGKVVVGGKSTRVAVNLMRHATNGDASFYIQHSRRRLAPINHQTWRSRITAFTKRAMDISVALVVLASFWPLMLVAAAAIKLESPGPILFRQQRCTRDGKLFTMLKLRTMVHDAEQQQAQLREANEVDGPMFKIRHDPRITRVGAFLRNTSLDEVPQMVNVLRGEMSLVGPRPLAPEEMIIAPHWRDLRLKVKPGMTGLWQVHGRRQHAFSDWIKYDIRYVKRYSLALDLKILVRTGIMVLQSFVHRESETEQSG